MEQFGNFLRGMASELTWPVADATGIEGAWDLTLTFSRTAGMAGRHPEALLRKDRIVFRRAEINNDDVQTGSHAIRQFG